MFAVASAMRKKSRSLDVVSVGPYGVFFAGFILLSWPVSAYMQLSGRFLFYHFACMLCVLVIVSTVERAQQLRRLAGMATLGLIIVSVYAIVQRIQGVEVNPSYVDLTLNENIPGRVYSMFENPNAFGEILVLLIPLAVGLMFASRSWGGRILGLLGAGLGSIALVMTYSRAGWIGLAVAALLFIFLWKKQLLPVVILLGIVAIPFLPDTVFQRILTIFNLSDTSTSSRFPLYEAALRLLRLRPLQGAGLGIDAVRSAVTDLNLYHGVSPFVHSHNIYLQVWAETGIFGLLALLGTVGWTLKRGAKTVLRQMGSSSVRMLVAGSVSALLGIMVCGIADFIWHYPRVMLLFWFLFAMAIAGIRLALREEKQRQGARRLDL
jgi:O-antigen ligase